MEWRLFPEGQEAHVSTLDFHYHRERAPHLEQGHHQARMYHALEFAKRSLGQIYVDLGCGDGGMLSLLRDAGLRAHGYDFQPSNAAGWTERGVSATQLNFVNEWHRVMSADVYMITEVLEHLTDPHFMVKRIYDRGAQIIASSPYVETDASHDECHAWAWDVEGYIALLETAGFHIMDHRTANDHFQIVWGAP